MNRITQATETMSTREIAALVEKQHSNIKISAERLAEKGIIGTLAVQEFDHNGNNYTEYLLGKRDSLVLVAQNCPEFTARIVDRWQELESKQPALPDFNDPVAAARAWADVEEQRQIATAQLLEQEPKIKVYERLAERRGDVSTTVIAKQLGTSAIKLNRWLREIGAKWLNADLPKAGYEDWFNVVSDVRNGHEFTQCLVTPAGQIEITKRWA